MLPVIKHRQLAWQVGAFGEFAFESSMDLDITMVFPVGSTFVFFGSWIYTADDSEKLQSHLVEIPVDQATLATHQDTMEDLVEKNPTWTQHQLT